MGAWDTNGPGVMRLPSGRLVRGRALRLGFDRAPLEFGVYLLGQRPDRMPWEARWVRWPDLRLPTDRCDARDALREARSRCASERLEIACAGGRGRTGTALACLAVLDGVPAREPVAYVRNRYDRRVVETPWQRVRRSLSQPRSPVAQGIPHRDGLSGETLGDGGERCLCGHAGMSAGCLGAKLAPIGHA